MPFKPHPTDPDKVIFVSHRFDSQSYANEYERGFIDGMQKQMQSSVDKAVNAMTKPTYHIPSKDQREWVGLTDEEIQECLQGLPTQTIDVYARRIEAKLKEKNHG